MGLHVLIPCSHATQDLLAALYHAWAAHGLCPTHLLEPGTDDSAADLLLVGGLPQPLVRIGVT